jgi:hypothetical protein
MEGAKGTLRVHMPIGERNFAIFWFDSSEIFRFDLSILLKDLVVFLERAGAAEIRRCIHHSVHHQHVIED